MKLSLHVGRGLANHNDRSFDIDKAHHINPDKSDYNVYWRCYEDASSNEEAEQWFYKAHFSAYLEEKNQRYINNGHGEKTQNMDELRTSKRYEPEETIYQIGRMGDIHTDEQIEEFERCLEKYLEWHDTHFSNIKILDYSIHYDEASPHVHIRQVYVAHDKNGNLMPNKNKALQEMGIERPEPDQPESRYNNRKVTYTAMCRSAAIQLASIYFDINPEPVSGRKHQETLEYKAQQTQKEIEEAIHNLNIQQKQVLDLVDDVNGFRVYQKQQQEKRAKYREEEEAR